MGLEWEKEEQWPFFPSYVHTFFYRAPNQAYAQPYIWWNPTVYAEFPFLYLWIENKHFENKPLKTLKFFLGKTMTMTKSFPQERNPHT